MTDSIFAKIIKGEVPAHKLYEDDKTLVFLDLFPRADGHCLVIPKVQIDKIYDVPDDYYIAMWQTAKKMAHQMEDKLGKRIFIKVIGTDVPHAHIHLIPQDENYDASSSPKQASDEKLQEIAELIRI